MAKKGLTIFLIKNSYISFYSINFALTDFLEQYKDENRYLNSRDLLEIENIRRKPKSLKKSYLFKKIEPFLLPFYERRTRSTDL